MVKTSMVNYPRAHIRISAIFVFWLCLRLSSNNQKVSYYSKKFIKSCVFQDVYFPTVIVCNINQVRRSLFRGLGATNESDISLLYRQFFTGMERNLTAEEEAFVLQIATSEVRSKPFFFALQTTTSRTPFDQWLRNLYGNSCRGIFRL